MPNKRIVSIMNDLEWEGGSGSPQFTFPHPFFTTDFSKFEIIQEINFFCVCYLLLCVRCECVCT